MNVMKIGTHRCSRLALPNGWSSAVKSVTLRAIALARYALTQAGGEACEGFSPCCSCCAENSRLREENSLLREEIRIKDVRMATIPAHRRPHYAPTERMHILELRAARGWSLERTARAFLVASVTISSWLRRIDEQGPDALVQLYEPVNKFPQFVGYLVRRLKTLCPTMGKAKIVQTLARAGLHLGATTVGRMLAAKPCPTSSPHTVESDRKPRVVTAKRPNHVWHVDLTVVSIGRGYWVPWLPLALPQCWPFCWWVTPIVDHYSRRVMGVAVFRRQPNSEQIRAALGRAMAQTQDTPKYIVCDKGPQFWSNGFKAWCQRRGIRPRYGAIGKHGSIAVVERAILTMKCLLVHWPSCRCGARRSTEN